MAPHNHWQLIALDDFERPSAPASTMVQKTWLRLQNMLGLTRDEDATPEEQDFPHYREFDLEPGVAAVEQAWEDSDSAPSVRFVVSPPFSGSGAILRAWAKKHGYQQLDLPDKEQLQSAETQSWWKPQQCERWLLDEFSSFWLRTTSHMQFIRALLPRLLRGELGQGVVVVDSWTFAFLQRAWPLSLPHCYCFAAATPELLRQVGIEASDKVLRKLNAKARGNVAVALALWALEQESERTSPQMPSEADDGTAFILYALLLHHGLKGEHLQLVLPMLAPDQLDVQLLRLQQNGVIEFDDDNVWRVTVYAYVDVRDFLAGRGYWLDAF
ncbi:hypothetical protein [Pseudidiomarina insulisalsae]|uniref:Uncharacterized protein n=1 Tax=Pseudidiomarina insulisalsae TaxID=575789 RepID=A0A432YR78_9GAMM|nr:hypothetical protein [Pseudidiomarina insulisalsae]RUO63759.1 hypothetical protein CWI71_01465 [Pseudidiomarina insulisalsae]